MTKLTTYEALKANIGKKIRFYHYDNELFGRIIYFDEEERISVGNFWLTDEHKNIYSIFNNIELIEEDNQEIPIKIDNALKSKIEEQLSNQEDPFKTNSPLKIRLGEEKELNNINHPSHYQLEINNKLVDVNTILEAISKKLDGKCDLMTWNYFSNACEYLLRSFFKGQQLSDLQKAKKEIEFIINKLEK
jgi:hypothetical protein